MRQVDQTIERKMTLSRDSERDVFDPVLARMNVGRGRLGSERRCYILPLYRRARCRIQRNVAAFPAVC